jgi:hypothetical protein
METCLVQEKVQPLPEIIADTWDAPLVDVALRQVLPERGVGDPAGSTTLGLTRWRIDDVDHVAAALTADPAPPDRSPAGSTKPGMDVVLAAVRARVRELAPGRDVVLDRDHDVSTVFTGPHVKISDPKLPPHRLVPLQGAVVPPGSPDGPVVGVADAQVGEHTDLAGRVLGWHDPTGMASALALGHATFVAGTVLRRLPEARLLCRPALIHGPEANRSWEVAERLMAFLDDDVAVLNMSFGCRTDGGAPLPLRRAMERLGGRTVLVAAAGNVQEDTPETPLYPAALPGVVGVGAVDDAGEPTAITPMGWWVRLRAPGVDVPGPFPWGTEIDNAETGRPLDTGYASWSGSSFAAAFVTGEIARLVRERGVDPFAARDAVLAGHASDASGRPTVWPVGSLVGADGRQQDD